MPLKFHASNIEKYNIQTNPKIWLINYRLAMKVMSTPDSNLMIQYLPLFLADSARTWLNYLGEKPSRVGSKESLCDYITRFTKCKNQLHHVPDFNIVNAFITGMGNEALIRDIDGKKNITVREKFDLAHEHVDVEDAVNVHNDKYKPHHDDNVDPSLSGKKDRKRKRDFVTNAEKSRRGKQKQNNGDKFDKIMNSPCQNHGFSVTHLAKDCNTYKKQIVKEGEKEAAGGATLTTASVETVGAIGMSTRTSRTPCSSSMVPRSTSKRRKENGKRCMYWN
jgi:hypothetical protein